MINHEQLKAQAEALYEQLLEAQHTSDAISKAVRLPYRAIPLQPIAEMREIVAALMSENRLLKREVASLGRLILSMDERK